MKKILLAFGCIGLLLGSCKKDEVSQTTFAFEKANYEITEDGAVTVKVIASAPVSEDITLGFTAGGSAEKGSDYTLSAESFSFASGESEATVDVTFTAINMEDLDITLSLQAPTSAGYALGETAQTRIAVPAKETVHYYFTTTNLDLITEMEVTLNLVTESAGTEYKAPREYRLPFSITTTAILGTDYEVQDGATEFVFAKGTNSATITLVSHLTTVSDPAPTISISVDEDKIPAEYKDLFTAGVNGTFEVTFWAPSFNDLVGKWAYSSFPLLDDPEADSFGVLDMIVAESGDDLNDLPHNNTSADIIEFKVEDGVNKMVTSLTGDLANYFMNCELTEISPVTFVWYHYYPERPLNAISATLSKVNYNFSATSTDEKSTTVYFGFSTTSDGRQLHVFVRNYTPTDFFTRTYIAYDGTVWQDGIAMGYWDLYFVFNEVTE